MALPVTVNASVKTKRHVPQSMDLVIALLAGQDRTVTKHARQDFMVFGVENGVCVMRMEGIAIHSTDRAYVKGSGTDYTATKFVSLSGSTWIPASVPVLTAPVLETALCVVISLVAPVSVLLVGKEAVVNFPVHH